MIPAPLPPPPLPQEPPKIVLSQQVPIFVPRTFPYPIPWPQYEYVATQPTLKSD
jgi:hypothetical protein